MPEIDAFILIVMLQQSLLGISLYIPLMSGQLSLASPAFFAIGGYLAAILSSYVAPLVRPDADALYPGLLVLGEMLLAAVLCFALAYGIGRLVLRLRGIYLALATLALVEIVRVACLNLEWTGGAIVILGIPQMFEQQQGYLWLFLPLFVLTLASVFLLEKSRLGRAFRALREDEYAAAAMGIDPARCKTMAFALGAAVAGMTGAASAHLLNTWNARQGTFDGSINTLAYVVIGGPWSVWGVSLGGALLSALPELLRPLQDYRLVVNGGLIVLASLYLPKGLIPDRWWARWRKSKSMAPTQPSFTPQLPVKSGQAETILELHQLTVQFGGLKAVTDLSFAVQRGEIFGLIGPNGAGKTTVFNALTGFVRATSGRVSFLARDLSLDSVHHRAQQGMIRTFQNLRLLKQQSVLDNVLSATHRFRKGQHKSEAEYQAEAYYWLQYCGLQEAAEVLAGGLNYGDQRRLELARALMARPEILLLDEPVAGMNLSEKAAMQTLIRRLRDDLGITIVIIEHHVPLVLGLCDRIAVLNFGQMIALGKPLDIQSHPDVRAAYLGTEEVNS